MANFDETYGGYESDSAIQSVNVNIGDPGADATIGLLRFPVAGRLRGAYATSATTLAAGTANYYSVHLTNGGTSGTAATSVSGTTGGTAGWVADTPKTVSLTSGLEQFTAGQWVNVIYDETGTVAENISIQIDYSLQPTTP